MGNVDGLVVVCFTFLQVSVVVVEGLAFRVNLRGVPVSLDFLIEGLFIGAILVAEVFVAGVPFELH